MLLQGHANLNRAVHDDIVAIEIFSEEKWSAPSDLVLEEDPDDEVPEGDHEEELEEGKAVVKLTDKVCCFMIIGNSLDGCKFFFRWRRNCGKV